MGKAMTSKSSNSKESVKTCGEPKNACNHGCVNHSVPIVDDKSNFDGNDGITEVPMATQCHREIGANFDKECDQEHEHPMVWATQYVPNHWSKILICNQNPQRYPSKTKEAGQHQKKTLTQTYLMPMLAWSQQVNLLVRAGGVTY